jgi:hypothetical protein
MLGEHLGEPTDQPSRGLVACPGDELGIPQHLIARQLAGDTVFVFELDVEQRVIRSSDGFLARQSM